MTDRPARIEISHRASTTSRVSTYIYLLLGFGCPVVAGLLYVRGMNAPRIVVVDCDRATLTCQSSTPTSASFERPWPMAMLQGAKVLQLDGGKVAFGREVAGRRELWSAPIRDEKERPEAENPATGVYGAALQFRAFQKSSAPSLHVEIPNGPTGLALPLVLFIAAFGMVLLAASRFVIWHMELVAEGDTVRVITTSWLAGRVDRTVPRRQIQRVITQNTQLAPGALPSRYRTTVVGLAVVDRKVPIYLARERSAKGSAMGADALATRVSEALGIPRVGT